MSVKARLDKWFNSIRYAYVDETWRPNYRYRNSTTSLTKTWILWGCWRDSKIKDRYNHATWMLDVSTLSIESQMSVHFAQLFTNSSLYRRNSPKSSMLHHQDRKISTSKLSTRSHLWLKPKLASWNSIGLTGDILRTMPSWFLTTIFASCLVCRRALEQKRNFQIKQPP